jgi:hypothetical protein
MRNQVDLGLRGGTPALLRFLGAHSLIPRLSAPNSYVRMVALLCIMGQIGSFVPAESAKLGILDGVYTRMGAGDDLAAGMSTFLVELWNTSFILHKATPRSLVILVCSIAAVMHKRDLMMHTEAGISGGHGQQGAGEESRP